MCVTAWALTTPVTLQRASALGNACVCMPLPSFVSQTQKETCTKHVAQALLLRSYEEGVCVSVCQCARMTLVPHVYMNDQ